ncbi:putative bifunctional diguanylate cyclase/phosphodiesterase [Humisphaera borealis]|uniref:EAL domain-containing protein n=1 Tax=Humisphaera borealis TaxID=2807512 RepID=A0A7M2X0E6_9BACT|nr:EAL domain-containing protein [Humisphaera borealis]QOV91247.1 EAL domain-containing protein [Humisphaera borealis]
MSVTPDNRRILLIDDNPQIHEDYRRCLADPVVASELDAMESELFGTAAKPSEQRPAFELQSAMQGEEALKLVEASLQRQSPFAVAFVDMRMPPGWDGLQTIEAIWAVDPRIQIVICTAYSDYSWDEITARLGRTDRLLILRKPFDRVEVCQLAAALTEKWSLTAIANRRREELEELVRERTSQLEQALRQDRLRLDLLEAVIEQRTAELRHAATHDKLTGLSNRSMLSDRLAHAIVRSHADRQRRWALLFLDLDDFKLVNDTLGHKAGDSVLVGVSQRLMAALRSGDVVVRASESMAVRLGGDEFVVLLENIRGVEDAEVVARRLLATLNLPHNVLERPVTCSASIGITTSEQLYEQVEDAVRDADIAMYRAKTEKNRYVVFDSTMHDQVVERVAMETELRQAIDRNQIALHYQPIVRLNDGELVGFEALMRWTHPTRGSIPPSRFIPVAEQCGVIRNLGLWSLDQAVRQVADWRHRFSSTPMTISVNLSPRQLADPTLVGEIRQIVGKSTAIASSLILEVTEGFLADDSTRAEDLLRSLTELGFHCYIDDFGTGYSSLSRLPKLPISGVKVDQCFVQRASQERKYAAVVNAVVNLSRNMDAVVVAEGLQTLEHVALLQALDCDQGQGFYFAPALPVDMAEQFIKDRPWRHRKAG